MISSKKENNKSFALAAGPNFNQESYTTLSRSYKSCELINSVMNYFRWIFNHLARIFYDIHLMLTVSQPLTSRSERWINNSILNFLFNYRLIFLLEFFSVLGKCRCGLITHPVLTIFFFLFLVLHFYFSSHLNRFLQQANKKHNFSIFAQLHSQLRLTSILILLF